MEIKTMANKLEKFTTPKGVAIYPKLSAPDTKFKPDGEFSCKLRLSQDDAQPLIDRIAEIHEANIKSLKESKKVKGAVKEASPPYKGVVDDEGNETGEVEFNIKMNHNIKTRDGKEFQLFPKLFDAKLNPIPFGTKIYGGSEVKVAGFFNPFYTAMIGAGVSLRLDGVQVLKLVQGNDAKSMGFAEENGYESAGNEAVEEQSEDEGSPDPKDDDDEPTEF